MIMEARAEAEKEGEDGKSELRQLADIERRYKGRALSRALLRALQHWHDAFEASDRVTHR